MHTYICKNCGKERKVKYKSHIKKFCSHQCANEYQWKQKDKKVIKLICVNCGREFEVKSSDYRLTHSGVKYCSKKCVGEALRTGSVIQCKQCGKEFYSTRHEFCSPKCAFDYRSEHSSHNAYYENGYIVEHKRGYNKKGNAKQHRIIMEEHLGRKLNSNEIVHHINGIKTDNRIENLQVMKRSEHSSFHRKVEKASGKHLFGGHHNN